MSACEICWSEASRKALILGGMTAERYLQELDAHPEHEEGLESMLDYHRSRDAYYEDEVIHLATGEED